MSNGISKHTLIETHGMFQGTDLVGDIGSATYVCDY